MSAPVCQFVDRVGTGAVQRLNLNDGQKLTLLAGPDQRPGPDFSPPALKRAVVNTLLAEGATIPASAYDNRIIRLPLRVTACDEEEMAEILETLHRELDRGQNILKWHPTYNSKPVYFRTFRSPDYRLDQTVEGRGELRATLTILAEPFAYGDRVDGATITINNDPAHAVNPMRYDVTGVMGDVPTPAYLEGGQVAVGLTGLQCLIAVRRHGTPGGFYVFQAEDAGALGADTTVQANSPLMSGAGNNWCRTTFATDITLVTRLDAPNCPGGIASSLEYRGTYRVFARVQKTVAGDDIAVQMGYIVTPVQIVNNIVTLPNIATPQLVDLGLLPVPGGAGPENIGYSGIAAVPQSVRCLFRASRAAGTGNLDWDYVLFVPADEELCIVDWPAGIGADAGYMWDGPNDEVFKRSGLNATIQSVGGIARVGTIPLFTPDQTNRLAFIRQIGTADAIADTTDFIVSYWPRYLYIR